MATVTKKQLTDRIADATGNKQVVVKAVVQRFLDAVIDELAKGNRLEFRGFGIFEARNRPQHMAQNPRTLERVAVPPKRVVKFKAGGLMSERVQKTLGDPSAVVGGQAAKAAASDPPGPVR